MVGGVGLKEREPKTWNTSNLGQRMGIDVMSASVAGGLVAPIICAIDKYGHPQNRNSYWAYPD